MREVIHFSQLPIVGGEETPNFVVESEIILWDLINVKLKIKISANLTNAQQNELLVNFFIVK